jgi:phenylalanyl-tRNA synthetase beta chain
MNIKILDSWLREYVKTTATPQKIAELLSLSSVSVERLEKYKSDYVYDIEITTNRPDLMSVLGLARETATVLQQNKIAAKFENKALAKTKNKRVIKQEATITIKNDAALVNRICAVVMDVTVKPTPEVIKNRLESTDIRSLNNLIDITNYVMRVTGHPTHVFDYDRIHTKKLTIRQSKPGEKIITLDKKEYSLPGGDIVADDGTGRIVDLLGIMGLENSVVTNETKRILFFIDNMIHHRIRKTSMALGIRTEAAVLNEKDPDPELAWTALQYGIKLYEELADGRVVSEPIDLYPNKIVVKTIIVSHQQIQTVMGVPISLQEAQAVLQRLDFTVKLQKDALVVTPPTSRAQDVIAPEDVIEEIARIYGYHNIPDILPPLINTEFTHLETDPFFWEDRVKDAMKYWGFTEVYTYPMISEALLENKTETTVKIANPLSEEFVYMRQTLIPSLLKVADENKDHEDINLFEIGNVYHRTPKDLPGQTLLFAGLIRKQKNSFYEVKGLIEQLTEDLGISTIVFQALVETTGAAILVEKTNLGHITIIDDQTIVFELNFEELIKHASLKKTYTPPSKYPPIIEDLALLVPPQVQTGEIIDLIKKQSPLIQSVSLLDKYEETRTFHILYQSSDKNLTGDEVAKIREKIVNALNEKLDVKLKI